MTKIYCIFRAKSNSETIVQINQRTPEPKLRTNLVAYFWRTLYKLYLALYPRYSEAKSKPLTLLNLNPWSRKPTLKFIVKLTRLKSET